MKKTIKLICQHCGQNLEVPSYLIGNEKNIECPACCYEVFLTEDEPDGWNGDLINQL